MYAITNITSYTKGTIYAPKGAELHISHYSGHVAFCSWNGGELFPCHVDKLSDTPIAPDKEIKKLTDKEAALVAEYNRLKR